MPIIELSTALAAAGSSVVVPFVNKVLGKTADRLGEKLNDQFVLVFTKAYGYLFTTGREPQAVAPKILLPLLHAAALEDEPVLTEIWAVLLANAADPLQRVQVQPGFVEILRQLTPDDAQVLAFIYAHHGQDGGNEPGEADSEFLVKSVLSHFNWPTSRIELSLDNLLRFRLFEALTGATYGPAPELNPYASVSTTTFGSQFLAACTPPTA